MPGRNANSGDYSYGFQGQLKDDEIKGVGNSINFEYRMHDPRLGRFFAIDPLAAKYPYNSPYAFSENRVIDGVELEGLEMIKYSNAYDKNNSYLYMTNEQYVNMIIKEDANWMLKTIYSKGYKDTDKSDDKEFWLVQKQRSGVYTYKYASEASYKDGVGIPYDITWSGNLIEWGRAMDLKLFKPDGWKTGLNLMLSTWATILSGGSLAAGEGLLGSLALGRFVGTVNLLASFDNLTANPVGKTMIQSIANKLGISDDAVNFTKLTFNIISLNSGLANVSARINGKEVNATWDMLNSVFTSFDVTKTIFEEGQKDNSNQKKADE